MSEAAEAMLALGQKTKNSAAIYVAQGQIPDEEDAIRWVPDQGLYADVVLTVPVKMNGVRTVALVSGDMFSCFNGAMHNRPLRKGEHVIVVFPEGNPNGHAIIVCKAHTNESAPGATAGFRNVTEKNMLKHNVDRFADGEDWHVETNNGSIFFRIKTDGTFQVQSPDGSHLCFAKKDDGNFGFKVKHAAGTLFQLSGQAVQMRSPNGNNFIQVDDEGVFMQGNVVRTKGLTLLNMDKEDVPAAQAVATSPPGVPSNVVTGSKTVFAGG